MKRAPKITARSRRPVAHRSDGAPRPVGCAIITASDTRRGRDDTAGALIERLVTQAGHRVTTRAWVKDEPVPLCVVPPARPWRAPVWTCSSSPAAPASACATAPPRRWRRSPGRAVPGFGERFRALSVGQVGTAAWLSRAGAFVARGRLVVMLPGSRAAVELALKRLLLPERIHAVRGPDRSSITEE